MTISGGLVGSYSQLGRTLVLVDEVGNELTGVVVGQETIFDATVSDVKIGKTFASDEGVQVGEDTRTYRVIHGAQIILPSKTFSVPLKEYDCYNYTKFQATISQFKSTTSDSVITDRVVLYDAIYNVNSDVKVADVTKNIDTKSVDLNIVNDTNNTYIIHFNTYKEE